MVDIRFSFVTEHGDEWITISEVLKWMNVTKEQFYLELTKFNVVSERVCSQRLVLKEATLFIPSEVSKRWVDILFEDREHQLLFNEEERQAMIYLMTFAQNEELSVFHFQESLFVSKNTILKDIKNLRALLNNQNIEFVYSRKQGFYLTGKESMIRLWAFSFVNSLLGVKDGDQLLYRYLFAINRKVYRKVQIVLSEMIQRFGLTVIPSRFSGSIYFVSFLLYRIADHSITFSEDDHSLLEELLVKKASEFFIAHFDSIKNREMETLYFTVLFMTIVQGEIKDASLAFLLECCREMIYEIERLAAIQFKNEKKLLFELFYHLVPAYFRIRFGFYITNVLIDEIKIQYGELFELTKLAVTPLEQLVKKEIPDEELGYFTILFGGEILNQKEKKANRQLNALILCPSGISSSLIMKSELKELFPQLSFREASSLEKFNRNDIHDHYDMIFSSVPVNTKKKMYVINPIMSQLEKNLLIRQVQEDFLFPKVLIPSVNEILEILIPHIELKKGVTKEKLYQILQKKVNIDMKRKDDDRPMLSELITADMIQIVEEQGDWEAAIALSAEPLKEQGKIEEYYVGAMIQKVKDYGPFINIGKNVALPHARPEDGVNEIGMSLLKLNKPVLLSNDEKHPITLFICLAAVDNETHLKALASLTKILSNKEKLGQLLEAETKEEILNVIDEGEHV